MIVLSPVGCEANPIGCRLLSEPQSPGIIMSGDFVIAGIFAVHDSVRSGQVTFTSVPSQLQCSGYESKSESFF